MERGAQTYRKVTNAPDSMAVSPLVASVITVPSSVTPPIPTIVPAIVATVVTEAKVHSHGGPE